MNTAEAIFKSLDEQVNRYIDGGAVLHDLYITMNQADYDTLRKHAETIWKRKTDPRMYCGLKIEVSGNDLEMPTVCYKSQYQIVGKVHIFDITSAPPNMTKRQMKKWAEQHPECDHVVEPSDFITPPLHPNGTPFDASKIDTKPIETTPQIVPKETVKCHLTNIVRGGFTPPTIKALVTLEDGRIIDTRNTNGYTRVSTDWDKSELWLCSQKIGEIKKIENDESNTAEIPPFETELYINNEPIGKHLTNIDRLLTEAIALSQISGDNSKAQMRDKIIEARRITEEIKRGK